MIITGPNGYGKSTVLRMIDYFCNNKLMKLINVSFKKFSITCLETNITIEKNKETFKINDFSMPYPDEKYSRKRMFFELTRRSNYDDYMYSQIKSSFIDSSISDKLLESISNDSFFLLLLANVLENSSKQKKEESIKTITSMIKCIETAKKEIGKVRFIQEQRLIEKKDATHQNDHIEYVTVINENSEKLKAELSNIMRNHSSLSSELDSTYITRLFHADIPSTYNTDEVSSQLMELKNKQEKLQKYGLAEIRNASELLYLDSAKLRKFNVELSIFLADASAKYEVFESIINKLELYEEIVNKKLSFKKMRLSSSQGIEVISEDGEKLLLNALSSGEQEILVLFYKLIFESDVNLLLIDEPEISLHIAWQKELLSDMRRVVLFKKNIQIIIATHSPQIIAQNWDLQIDLGCQFNG